jgi:hypothetical protein
MHLGVSFPTECPRSAAAAGVRRQRPASAHGAARGVGGGGRGAAGRARGRAGGAGRRPTGRASPGACMWDHTGRRQLLESVQACVWWPTFGSELICLRALVSQSFVGPSSRYYPPCRTCLLPYVTRCWQVEALEQGAAEAQQQMAALGAAGAALEGRAAALEAATAEAGGCIATHQVTRRLCLGHAQLAVDRLAGNPIPLRLIGRWGCWLLGPRRTCQWMVARLDALRRSRVLPVACSGPPGPA